MCFRFAELFQKASCVTATGRRHLSIVLCSCRDSICVRARVCVCVCVRSMKHDGPALRIINSDDPVTTVTGGAAVTRLSNGPVIRLLGRHRMRRSFYTRKNTWGHTRRRTRLGKACVNQHIQHIYRLKNTRHVTRVKISSQPSTRQLNIHVYLTA